MTTSISALKGVSMAEIVKAIQRGQKRRQKHSDLIEAYHSYYSVVYAEFFYKRYDIHKVYPITVKT